MLQVVNTCRQVTARTEEATRRKAKVEVEKEACAASAADVMEQKQACELELEGAMPILEAAKGALDKINPGEINTLKKMGKPPNLVKRVLDTVLLLKTKPVLKVEYEGDKNGSTLAPSWDNSIKMMGENGFLATLMSFEKDGITDETCELMQPYLEMVDFNFEKVTCLLHRVVRRVVGAGDGKLRVCSRTV